MTNYEIAGEWWKQDIVEVYNEFLHSGTDPNISDAYTINGQPGDLYPCSKSGIIQILPFSKVGKKKKKTMMSKQ